LTFAEINDHLPEMLEVEQIEGVVSMINDMGISVSDQAPDAGRQGSVTGAGDSVPGAPPLITRLQRPALRAKTPDVGDQPSVPSAQTSALRLR